ncbi:MAG: replicative DNA helicase [Rickettsiales bacterium]|nr:MAG: replicative DNA helicase [Rickettsiales bacterium]
MTERQNLFNVNAEQVILGTIILNNDYYGKVEEILKPDFFYEPVHQKIFEKIAETTRKSDITADSITLKYFFDADETIKKVGGSTYLDELLKKSVGIVDIVGYANLVKDFAIKRKLIEVGETLVNDTYNKLEPLNSNKLIENIEDKLFELTNELSNSSSLKGFSPLGASLKQTTLDIDKAMKTKTGITGIKTNLKQLDEYLTGFQNSDLIILAGATSMGKTALAVNLLYGAAKNLKEEGMGRSAGIFSLEMSTEQIAQRILALETGISMKNFKSGNLHDYQYQKILDAEKEISELPIFVDDTPSLTIASIRTRVQRMYKQKKIAFLVVDYLQLAKGTTKQSDTSRHLEIAEITRGLKAIAKEFNIPVIALAQLNRNVDNVERANPKPSLSDLRESGSIEQDADIVMFVYREWYYERNRIKQRKEETTMDFEKRREEELKKIENDAIITIAKNRNGPTRDIKVKFHSEFGRFSDWISKEEEQSYLEQIEKNKK